VASFRNSHRAVIAPRATNVHPRLQRGSIKAFVPPPPSSPPSPPPPPFPSVPEGGVIEEWEARSGHHRDSMSLDPRTDRGARKSARVPLPLPPPPSRPAPPRGGNYDAVLISHCVAAPSFRRVSQAAVDTSVSFRMEWKERVRSHESAGSVEGPVAEVSAFSLV